ncbi:ankyrin repeat-containing domain protein [Morchella snyderi]|nr:ankyrin repeat-containing domain protein [Morchella snyderi]
MMAKLDLDSVTAGSAPSSGASIAGSVRTTRSVLSFSSARTNFASTLNNSRVYRRALLGRVMKTGPPAATGQSSALSIQQPWSVLSAVSLSEVSNYAVYSLPISAQELYNPTWYTTPSPIVSLEPSMCAAAPTFLVTAFVEALKIALKQNDVETANTLANYIPWNIALEMSAVYQRPTADTSISPGGKPDYLAIFGLWLRCGGDAEAKDQHGETAIIKAAKDRDWALFKLIIHNGSDISSTWNSNKTGFHLSSEGGDENLLLGVSKDIEANEGAEVTPVCPGLKPKRGWAVKDLLSLREVINDRDERGATVLHNASKGGHWEVVEVLLSQGVDIEARDMREMTALHRASAAGQKDVVQVLLGHAAAIEGKDIRGMTALQFAVAGGHKDVVEILLGHGPKPRTAGG